MIFALALVNYTLAVIRWFPFEMAHYVTIGNSEIYLKERKKNMRLSYLKVFYLTIHHQIKKYLCYGDFRSRLLDKSTTFGSKIFSST